MRERDPEKRKALYVALQRKLLDDGPFIIMFQRTIQVARRNAVSNFVLGPSFDLVPYRLVAK